MATRKPSKSFVFIFFDQDNERADSRKKRSTHISIKRQKLNKRDPIFSNANLKKIETKLSSHFVYTSSQKLALEQNVLLAEILRHEHGHNVDYYHATSGYETKRFIQSSKTIEEWKNTVAILIFHDQNGVNTETTTLADAHDELEFSRCPNVLPCRIESHYVEMKTYDIQAFDAIARKLKKNNWRPLSCFQNRKGPCPIGGERASIIKRSHSSCASNVQFKHPSKDGRPVCETEIESRRYEKYEIIHQEYVPILRELGEFRIFVATRDGEKGERVPYIVHSTHTGWQKKALFDAPEGEHDPGSLDVMKVTEETYRNAFHTYTDEGFAEFKDKFGAAKVALKDLQDFVLQWYSLLQKHDEVHFDSLKVGARVDVSFTPAMDGFFINELTRWYSADGFAMDTLEVGERDLISRAWARSLAECYSREAWKATNAERSSEIVDLTQDTARKITQIDIPSAQISRRESVRETRPAGDAPVPHRRDRVTRVTIRSPKGDQEVSLELRVHWKEGSALNAEKPGLKTNTLSENRLLERSAKSAPTIVEASDDATVTKRYPLRSQSLRKSKTAKKSSLTPRQPLSAPPPQNIRKRAATKYPENVPPTKKAAQRK